MPAVWMRLRSEARHRARSWLVGGRLLWTVFADRSGIVPEAATPANLFYVFPSIIVAAVAIAMVPARSAARTKAALVLRTE